MRYPTNSTGIPDVDEQHRAIDSLIALYRKARGPEEERRCLTALTEALRVHFQFVENYFEVRFPSEFRQRRDAILAWLAHKERQRVAGRVSQEALADEFSRILLFPAAAPGDGLSPLGE